MNRDSSEKIIRNVLAVTGCIVTFLSLFLAFTFYYGNTITTLSLYPFRSYLFIFIFEYLFSTAFTGVNRSFVFRSFVKEAFVVFQFTCLQVYLAMKLNIGIGSYTHIAGSLHLYARDFEKAIIECAEALSKINTYDLLIYIQKELWLGGDGIDYQRAIKIMKGCIAWVLADTYEIDIGYPGDNLVTSFNITDNNSWALLYDYAQKIDINNYVYTIDKNGDIKSDYSLNIATSKSKKRTTAENQTWWTQMTQFPINATLVIKGLIRPVMLMTYLRVNAMFYGQKHISSGLYIITKQEDTVDKTGYRTTLSLMRVAGDNDVFIKQS